MIRFLLFAAVASASAFSSAADILTVTAMSPGKFTNLTISYNSANLTIAAGPQSIHLNGGARFDSYCVDLDNSNSIGASYAVDILTQASLTNGERVGFLFDAYAGSVTDADKGAALQLAIWDVVVDNGDGLSSGNFKYTQSPNAAVLSQAAAYLSGSAAQSSSIAYFRATSHPGNRNQNLIGPSSYAPVPEPVTMLIGAAALGIAGRRRARNA